MCGFAGMVHVDPTYRVSRSTLEIMNRSLRHRGPDDSGVWLGDGVGLAHRRLSIIDLSPAGRQPMANEAGTVQVVYNGEIYNFRELRRELEDRGHQFRSRTDTEVIVHLYEEEEVDCVRRLEGMFAVAIWDIPRRRLLLARDRVGKKPLKYAKISGGLLFASELKAILATGLVDRSVEPEDIDHFISFAYVPSPGTGFSSIRKLPPGHRLVWENGATKIERYWSLDFRKKEIRSERVWKELVRETVTKAVAKRLISDVPLGVFLSGGIDSSIVVACMARSSSRPIETFSVGFEFEDYNELPYAKLVADRYATSHHEFIVRADAASLLPRLARLYEEPYADPSALPSYLLARETRRHVTVALNGDGGDEGFVGYPRYARLADWEWRLTLARRIGLHRLAKGAASFLAPGLSTKLEAVHQLTNLDAGKQYAWMMRLFSRGQKTWLYGESMRASLVSSNSRLFSRLASDPRAGDELIDMMLFTDTMSYLPEDLLAKMDLACMAHGLETRSPLLDHEVLELAASAPVYVKYRGRTLKWLLKEAFREELPQNVLRRGKQGFEIPLEEWFRGPLLPVARELLLSPTTRVLNYFRPRALSQLVERHAKGGGRHGRQLWGLLMLELWQREVVDSPPQSA